MFISWHCMLLLKGEGTFEKGEKIISNISPQKMTLPNHI
jgi:hypothetical protein